MLYMVIEYFNAGAAVDIYRRVHEKVVNYHLVLNMWTVG
jgi:hypothetical protein